MPFHTRASAVPSTCISRRPADDCRLHDQSIMISIKLSAAMNAQLLHVIAIWSGSTAAGATFKDSLSFSTEYSLHRRLGPESSTLTGRAADYGCRSELVNHRLTTLRS